MTENPSSGHVQDRAQSNADSVFLFHEGAAPDERQQLVALELGYSKAELDAMANAGMRASDYAKIVPAAELVSYLESRYQVAFRAKWVTPTDSHAGWKCAAVPEDTRYRQEEFRATAFLDEGTGKVEWYDDFYGEYRHDEYQESVSDAFAPAFDQLGIPGDGRCVDARIVSEITSGIPLDAPLGNLGSYARGSIDVYLTSPEGLGRTEGEELADRLAKELEGKGLDASLELSYLPTFPDGVELTAAQAVRFTHEGAANVAWYVLR